MPELQTSNEQIILTEAYLQIRFLPEHRLIQLEWKGYAPSKGYRVGLDTALEFVLENDVTCWLADLRGMAAILQDDEKWTNEVWFPQLANSGLEKMAILRSADFFNVTSVDRIMAAAMEVVGFEVAYYRTREEAVAWLLA